MPKVKETPLTQIYSWENAKYNIVKTMITYEYLLTAIIPNEAPVSRSNACSKGWKSFYALIDMDISRVNQTAMAHLYKTIVLTSFHPLWLWNMEPHKQRRLETSKHASTRNYKTNSRPPKTRPVRYLWTTSEHFYHFQQKLGTENSPSWPSWENWLPFGKDFHISLVLLFSSPEPKAQVSFFFISKFVSCP